MTPSDRPASASKPLPHLMGILNVTPDSFSDGGQFAEPGKAAARAREMVAEGADLLDIGAESTRPGFTPVSAETELRRLVPVFEALLETFEGAVPVPVSVDTTKASVAAAAMTRGATIVNDIWGFQGDVEMPDVVARHGARAILMHNRRAIDQETDIVDDMLRFFERSLVIAAAADVPIDRLILDPGIGFGKSPAQQVQALAGVGRLATTFGLPILVGASRKSFLKPYVGEGAPARLFGTLAAHLAAVARGASILRVHDVAAHAAALRVTAAIDGAEA